VRDTQTGELLASKILYRDSAEYFSGKGGDMAEIQPGQLYTLGYSGWKMDELLHQMDELTALLVDIRYSPFSRHAIWAKSSLERALGDRYVHVRALGNEHYKGGPVKLMDYDAGKLLVQSYLSTGRNTILMCVCEDVATCHRLHVAGLLETDLGIGSTIHLMHPRSRKT
jgi:hypothetical protein